MTVRILRGDVRENMAKLPSDSFDCIVTSPPYWGLRDYGVAGQIGLEPTLTEYLDTMVAVCRELRRVLKPSGTFWLNVGDSYAANRGGTTPPAETLAGGQNGQGDENTRRGRKDGYNPSRDPTGHGLKHKDLCLVPNRLAIRLQEDGWYVRSEIIWHKPNPMPESVTDRPTSAHEKIWLLTKNERYAYDADAIKEESVTDDPRRPYGSQGAGELDGRPESQRPNGKLRASANRKRGEFDGKTNALPGREAFRAFTETRNARNVWTIATQRYSEAHFATFPPELAERCIKAGCPVGGRVLDPFGGAGTTGMVADRLGRDATLIELNTAYVTIIKNRIAEDAGMFAQVAAE